MTKEEAKAIDDIIKACETLGWHIAMPIQDNEDEVPGLVIGTNEYLEYILDLEDESDD